MKNVLNLPYSDKDFFLFVEIKSKITKMKRSSNLSLHIKNLIKSFLLIIELKK